MSVNALRRFRFATEAQWQACLFARADRDALGARGGVRPYAPFAAPGVLHGSRGGHAPVATGIGEIVWRDADGVLHRLTSCDEHETHPAPSAIARATRSVSTSSGLWVVDPPASIHLYEDESLSRVLTVDLPGAEIADIASDGRERVMVLARTADGWRAVRIDRAGDVVGEVALHDIHDAVAFAYLPRSKRFVVLTAGAHPRLCWFDDQGGRPIFSTIIGGLRPCFDGRVLAGDRRDRVFLAGADGPEFGGRAFVLVLDADGNSIGEVPVDPEDMPVTGVAAGRDVLLVTGPRGLRQFTAADVVPEDAGQVGFTIVTPMLHAPDREDRRRWLRIEASAQLPEGTTIEIAYAATDKADIRDRLNTMLRDSTLSESQRIARLLAEPDIWRGRTEYAAASAAPVTREYSAKLFDTRDPYIWVSLTLTAAPGARLPVLSELAVLYPGRTLMENLPAIYQAEEERADSFLRGLVGVLEATTQGLDARIASMGRRIHPSTATGSWLDFIARWLGLPWDDAMTPAQKRAIVTHAAELAERRGTRAGLETLLESLFPGTPKKYRVTDATADFGFAMVGGAGCVGSALPAMLGGRTRWTRELGADAVLGVMRLPCDGERRDTAQHLAGRIRIDIAATDTERRQWEPWLAGVIADMVPLTSRVELRWAGPDALRSNRLDGTMTLESAPAPRLGSGALTGVARLPDRGARLSGSSLSTRLR